MKIRNHRVSVNWNAIHRVLRDLIILATVAGVSYITGLLLGVSTTATTSSGIPEWGWVTLTGALVLVWATVGIVVVVVVGIIAVDKLFDVEKIDND